MRVKKSGFTLIELMAVIVIVCVMLLIGSSILFQCLKINKKTDNNTIMENKYRTIISNVEKDVKSSDLVEVYNNGKKIEVVDIGVAEELLYFKEKESEKISYMYVLTQKDNDSLKELHLLKIKDKNLNKDKVFNIEEDKLVEDSISDMNITKSNDLEKLIDVKVNLKRMDDTREYISSISKSNFTFKDEIKNECNVDDFLNTTINNTINVLSEPNQKDVNDIFRVNSTGAIDVPFATFYVQMNNQKELILNDLEISGHKYGEKKVENKFDSSMKPIKGPNLNFQGRGYDTKGRETLSGICTNANLVATDGYSIKNEKGETVGVAVKLKSGCIVILINGDLNIEIAPGSESWTNLYVYCTGTMTINLLGTLDFVRSNLISNNKIFINNGGGSLKITGFQPPWYNPPPKDELKIAIQKYIKNK